MNMIRDLVALHHHSGMMITYCSITGVCVWLSARDHLTFHEWIAESDWSAFALWHMQFHICYLLYYTFNWIFLGSLRPFERIKARKGQLEHFMNTLIFIIVVCGLDIFEGFCWLHWITPFSFFRMSLVVISERLENPPPPTTTTIRHDIPAQSENSSHHSNEKSRNPIGFSNVPLKPSSVVDLHVNHADTQDISDEAVFSSNDPCINRNDFDFHITLHNQASPNEHQHTRITPPPPVVATVDHSSTQPLIAYLLVLIVIVFLWSLCGALVFQSLPFASKLMVLYEPIVCCLQWTVVFFCVLSCDSGAMLGMSKDDLKFGVEWVGGFICQFLSTCRYAIVWLLFGHSLIFNAVDILIFMKLKGCFSSLSTSVHNLRLFLAVRRILNKSLPTVYPPPNHPIAPVSIDLTSPTNMSNNINEDTLETSTGFTSSETTHPNAPCIPDDISLDSKKKPARRRIGTRTDSSSDSQTTRDTINHSSPIVIVGKGILGHVARFLNIFRSFYGGPFSGSPLPNYWSSDRSHPHSSSSHSSSSSSAPIGDLYPICIVCRDPMTVAKQLPCGHILHQHCLRQWLDTDLTCPICRSSCLPTSDEENLRSLLGRTAHQHHPLIVTPTESSIDATLSDPDPPFEGEVSSSSQHNSVLNSDNKCVTSTASLNEAGMTDFQTS